MQTPRSVTYSAVFVGYVLGVVALDAGLPTEIPPSWTASNGDIHWLGSSMVAFLLPTAVAVVDMQLRREPLLTNRPMRCVNHRVGNASSGMAPIRCRGQHLTVPSLATMPRSGPPAGAHRALAVRRTSRVARRAPTLQRAGLRRLQRGLVVAGSRAVRGRPARRRRAHASVPSST